MIGNFKKSFAIAALFFYAGASLATGECNNLDPMDGLTKITPKGNSVSFQYSFVDTFKIKERAIARRTLRAAEAKAKRAFVEWMKNQVAVSSQIDEAFASSDTYGAETESIATELKTQVDSISQKGEQALTGVTTIGNCIDMENGEAGVTIAWSPALSSLATSASVTQSRDSAEQEQAKTATSSSSQGDKIEPYRQPHDNRGGFSNKSENTHGLW